MRRALWALVIAVPLVTLLAAGFGRDPNAVRSPLVEHRAPLFALHTFEGKRLSLTALRGRPIVINFWASWCVSCADEHAALRQAWSMYRSRGVAFVGVDYQDHMKDAQSFLRSHGGAWPELQDPGARTAILYGVYGVPETYFIDRRGVVRYKSTGPVTSSVLRKQIERILG